MGNDEAIIYGSRHGEHYRQYEQKTDDAPQDVDLREIDRKNGIVEKQHYPNAIIMHRHPGGVELGVITFDQETGERDYGWDSDAPTSFFTTLDRNGLNRLIRDARKMRDAVFEPDA